VKLLGRLREPLLGTATRGRDRPFVEAAMSAAALVAASAPSVSLARHHLLDEVLESVPALRAADATAAAELFRTRVEALRATPEAERSRALAAVAACAGDGEQARVLLRIATALARADGPVEPPAAAAVAELARVLNQPSPDLRPGRRLLAGENGRRPVVLVLGNEKGGTGKSTTAMHLAVALLRRGHAVGSIDLDGRQGTLSRYVANRETLIARSGADVPVPIHQRVPGSEARDRQEAREIERGRLKDAFARVKHCDFVVIDTPGNNSHLSRLGHGEADVLITPLNDSFVDIDVIAQIDQDRREVLDLSPYSRMVAQQNEQRAAAGDAPIDWVVMRNRLAQIEARNTREMAALLARLAERMNFRLQPGLSERVVFRELFYRGLTLLDLPDESATGWQSASHRRARREVRDLLAALGLDDRPVAASEGVPRH
jgi:chromosome partitioning protein